MYGRVWFLALIPIPKTRLDPPVQSHLSYPGLLMKQLLEIGASTHQNLAKVMESFAFRSCESLSRASHLGGDKGRPKADEAIRDLRKAELYWEYNANSLRRISHEASRQHQHRIVETRQSGGS